MTGEAARNHVNRSLPLCSVKFANVGIDWEGGESPIILPLSENPLAIGVDFDGADGAPSKELPSQDAAACPCK